MRVLVRPSASPGSTNHTQDVGHMAGEAAQCGAPSTPYNTPSCDASSPVALPLESPPGLPVAGAGGGGCGPGLGARPAGAAGADVGV